MRHQRLALLLTCLCGLASPGLPAERLVHLVVPPPVRKDIAAMPEIAAPVDDAERHINAAVKQFDRDVLKVANDCKGGDWSRVIEVPMRGPGFLSFTVTDSMACAGAAHPDSGTMAIVYDLTTGKPVDWTRLLPASLTGTLALDEQSGTKTVTLSSKRLFDLYMAGYRASAADDADLKKECRQALLDSGADGAPPMTVWLDAKAGGLAVEIGLAHVEAVCEEPVVIPAAVLRAEGAQPALLKAFGAAQLQPEPRG